MDRYDSGAAEGLTAAGPAPSRPLALAAMGARRYHEELWQQLPAGLDPVDFRSRRAFLLESVTPGLRVLDIGCGEGRFAAVLAAAGAEVVAVDVAGEPLRRARAEHPDLDLRLVEPDGPWDLPDASFDLVWAGEVIEHVLDTAAWMSQVRRVLVPGGRLLLSTPDHGRALLMGLAISRRAFARHFDPRSDHLRFYARETLTALLEDFRFEEISVRRRGRLLLARAVRSRF